MAIHNNIGRIGEDKAAQIMKEKGYTILETNWHMGHLEVDVIAENANELVFVEVKTRTSTFGNVRPEEYADEIKKRRIIAAGNAYVKYHKIEKSPRFDVIGIQINPTNGEFVYINHIENAFVPRVRTIHSNSFNGQMRWKHKGHFIK